jgi:hypothetical protein
MKTATSLAFQFLTYCLASTTNATAATIFESGTLGPTGVTWTDLTSGAVPGANISTSTFNGARFQLNQPATTTKIGGHFVAQSTGTLFGVIVELDDEHDFPDSDDLTTSDVLGHTILTFPDLSGEAFGNFPCSLNPGWYALLTAA